MIFYRNTNREGVSVVVTQLDAFYILPVLIVLLKITLCVLKASFKLHTLLDMNFSSKIKDSNSEHVVSDLVSFSLIHLQPHFTEHLLDLFGGRAADLCTASLLLSKHNITCQDYKTHFVDINSL